MRRKYYSPNKRLVESLKIELQNLESRNETNREGEKKEIFKRKKESRNRMAKKKFDNTEHIFQAFADLLYFFEFIEFNYDKLGNIYEDVLKDLLGFNIHYSGDSDIDTKSNHSRQSFHGPLSRLIKAVLLVDRVNISSPASDRLDFRTVLLSKVFISLTVKALEARFTRDEELYMISNDFKRFRFWGNYLANQVRDKTKPANRRIKYVPLN